MKLLYCYKQMEATNFGPSIIYQLGKIMAQSQTTQTSNKKRFGHIGRKIVY